MKASIRLCNGNCITLRPWMVQGGWDAVKGEGWQSWGLGPMTLIWCLISPSLAIQGTACDRRWMVCAVLVRLASPAHLHHCGLAAQFMLDWATLTVNWFVM